MGGYWSNFVTLLLNYMWAYAFGSQDDVDRWGEALQEWWSSVWREISRLTDNLKSTYQSAWDWLKAARSWLNWLWQSAAANVEWLVTDAWNSIVWLASTAYSTIRDLINNLYDRLNRLARTLYANLDRLATTIYSALDRLATTLYANLDRLATALFGWLDWLATTAKTNIEWLVYTAWDELVSLATTLYGALNWLASAAYVNLVWLCTTAWVNLSWLISQAVSPLHSFFNDPVGYVAGALKAPWLAWLDLWSHNQPLIGGFVTDELADVRNLWSKHRSSLWDFLDDPTGYVLARIRDTFIDWLCALIAERW